MVVAVASGNLAVVRRAPVMASDQCSVDLGLGAAREKESELHSEGPALDAVLARENDLATGCPWGVGLQKDCGLLHSGLGWNSRL